MVASIKRMLTNLKKTILQILIEVMDTRSANIVERHGVQSYLLNQSLHFLVIGASLRSIRCCSLRNFNHLIVVEENVDGVCVEKLI